MRRLLAVVLRRLLAAVPRRVRRPQEAALRQLLAAAVAVELLLSSPLCSAAMARTSR